MADFLRDFIHDVWAADAALEAWRRGDTGHPLPRRALLAYGLISGLAVVAGIAWACSAGLIR